ncbi:hypothetical protein HN51_050438 [Arachis hypogaea]
MSGISPKKNPLPYLGDDLVWKILTKADPKTVGRCRTLNKSWNFRLNTPYFVKQNWAEQKGQNINVIVGVGNPPADENSQWFIRADVNDGVHSQLNLPIVINQLGFYSLIGSDHGVLCIKLSQGGLNSRLLIWNPLTGMMKYVFDESKKHSRHHVSVFAFGYLYDSMEYRIVHVFKRHYIHRTLGWSLYCSFENDWCDSGSFTSDVQKLGPKSIIVDGIVYWIGWEGTNFTEPSLIISFSMIQRQFFESIIPIDARSTYHSLTNLHDGVGFIPYRNIGFSREVIVWEIKHDGQDKLNWDKRIRVTGLGIPYNPSMFIGKDIISIMECRSRFGGSNDADRTDLLLSRLKWNGARREHLMHRTWQQNVHVKSMTMHSESLYIV